MIKTLLFDDNSEEDGTWLLEHAKKCWKLSFISCPVKHCYRSNKDMHVPYKRSPRYKREAEISKNQFEFHLQKTVYLKYEETISC